MPVDLRGPKSEASRALPPGHPGREALLFAPDAVSEAEFNALIATWIHLLRAQNLGR